jgi:hypothetical protein
MGIQHLVAERRSHLVILDEGIDHCRKASGCPCGCPGDLATGVDGEVVVDGDLVEDLSPKFRDVALDDCSPDPSGVDHLEDQSADSGPSTFLALTHQPFKSRHLPALQRCPC